MLEVPLKETWKNADKEREIANRRMSASLTQTKVTQILERLK
jgi:hypothetical protein